MSTGNRWVGANVPEETFDCIYNLCSVLGQPQRYVIPELIELGIQAKTKELQSVPPEIELWNIIRELNKRYQIRNMLENLGSEAKATRDTKLMDVFEEQCQKFGFDPSEFLEQVDAGAGPTPIEIQANGTSTESCIKWLKRKMNANEWYEQSDIMGQAIACGFKEHIVNRAKPKAGVDSRKRSKVWWWIRRENGGVRVPLTVVLPDEEEEMVES